MPALVDDDQYPESDISYEDDSYTSYSNDDYSFDADSGSDKASADENIELVDVEDSYYTPISGQDIYGNTKSAENIASAVKYVPPALRQKMASVIDEVQYSSLCSL